MDCLDNRKDIKYTLMKCIEKIAPAKYFTRPTFEIVQTLQREGKMSKDCTIVEIGTDLGMNAKNIIRCVSFDKLYLVDPYFEDYYQTRSGSYCYKVAKNRVGNDKRVTFIRKTSMEALKYFEDESVDAVYIDGNHRYLFVYNDVKSWYKKVKYGGVIGGHDFFGSAQGVVFAVTDFVNENNLRKKLDGFGTDWWIRK